MGVSFLTANHLNHSLLTATCDWHPATEATTCTACGVVNVVYLTAVWWRQIKN